LVAGENSNEENPLRFGRCALYDNLWKVVNSFHLASVKKEVRALAFTQNI